MNAGFSDRYVAHGGNTIVPPLIPHEFRIFCWPCVSFISVVLIAIVRLRRNQNSAMLPFLVQIEDKIKASGDFKLISLSAQSTHLDYMLVPIGSHVLTQFCGPSAKIPSPLEVASQSTRLFADPTVISIHHFGYITSWRLRNSPLASLLSQHCWRGLRQLFAPHVGRSFFLQSTRPMKRWPRQPDYQCGIVMNELVRPCE